jgi:hypothetical protein
MTVLNKTFKAAAVALALAGTAVTAMPANAQSFGFSVGNDNFRFGIHAGDFWDGHRWRPRHNNVDFCMSDREVRRDLRRDGYDEIRFFDRRGRVVQVTAELGRRDYRIAYDTCRGRIVDRDRIG